jgi:hypothetical protein
LETLSAVKTAVVKSADIGGSVLARWRMSLQKVRRDRRKEEECVFSLLSFFLSFVSLSPSALV